MVTIANRWRMNAAGIIIPMGIIIPFNDIAANIPADWSQWTSGNNKALLGEDLYTAGEGGSTYVSRTSTSDGNHTGNGSQWWSGWNAGSDMDRNNATKGGHSHSLRVYYTPARRYQIMMKAGTDLKVFPANTGILSDLDLTSAGLTDITNTGEMLYGTNGSVNSSSALSKSIGSVNSAGGHTHLNGAAVQISNFRAAWFTNYSNKGASTHSGSATVTDNMYRYFLGMWANASAAMEALPGMYGIWESDIMPKGWALCDGNNGTPALNNYHIGLDSSKAGTKEGTGEITTSGSLASNGSHQHTNGSGNKSYTSTGYHSLNTSHSHSIGGSTSSYNPEYHKVVIIKAIG
jgi:hypothetical protein